jgi:hypothetical protein
MAYVISVTVCHMFGTPQDFHLHSNFVQVNLVLWFPSLMVSTHAQSHTMM